MKKMVIGIMMVSLMTTYALGVSAAPPSQKQGPKKPGPGQKQFQAGPKQQQLRADAKYIINRTAKALADAQRIARKGRYRSGFARAMAHQQKARELYAGGNYREAIYFSLHARELTIEIIKRNKVKMWSEFAFDKREKYYNDGPRGKELDARLDKDRVGKDRDALRITIELNI